MQRLLEKNINTAEEYSRIYEIRKRKPADRVDLKRWDLLLKHYHGGKLIDLGCLDSLIPIKAKLQYPKCEIWGLDQSKEAIEHMEARHPTIFYQVGDIYDTKFANHYFNYAVLGEVLEHLDDPKAAIKEAFRILKRHGTLAISVPYNEAREPGAVDGQRHIWSYTEQDIKDLVAPHQVQIEIMYDKVNYHYPNIIAFARK